MEDIVSELAAQALSQIAENHPISNDNAEERSITIGEGIMAQIDNVRTITSTDLETARQEFISALEEAANTDTPDTPVPPNTFGGILDPVGDVEELTEACNLLGRGEGIIITDSLADSINSVYHVEIRPSGGSILSYWVNRYWHDRLVEAGSVSPSEVEEPEVEESNEEIEETVHHEIPENSQTLTVDETTSRFSGAIWYEAIQKKTIILAGVGGIGSHVGFLLGRLKPEYLFIYDPDIVEAVNMSGQLYGRYDIGSSKVFSLSRMVSKYADFNRIVAFQERFTQESEPADIMICGFDNMAARKVFYNRWLLYVANKPKEERKNCLFIDGRLAAEEFQVFAIQGDDVRAQRTYEDKWLFSDYQAEETVCSYKQTTFMANMIASVMVNIFVNFVANECDPLVPRDVPFLTSYTADTMFFKVEM